MARGDSTLVAAALAAAFFLFGPSASAQARPELGLRSGYGLPIGKVYDREGNTSGNDLDEVAKGQVPLWFDIGARIGERVFVGAYVQYGIIVFSDRLSRACDQQDREANAVGGSVDCNLYDLRLGANVHYHFGAPGTELDPWVGGGIGMEWISETVSAETGNQSADLTVTFSGFELLNLQAGLDFKVSEAGGIGPFVAFTLASYETGKLSCDGDCGLLPDTQSESIDDQALHHWLFFGLRGDFVL